MCSAPHSIARESLGPQTSAINVVERCTWNKNLNPACDRGGYVDRPLSLSNPLQSVLFVDHMQSGWPFFWSFFVSFFLMVEDLGLHATLDLGLPTCITHSQQLGIAIYQWLQPADFVAAASASLFCMSRLHCIIEFPLGSQRRLSYTVIPWVVV